MELVTKREAARCLGVSIDTIERRLKRGELRGHKEHRPHGLTWLVELPEDTVTPGTNGAVPPADASGNPPAGAPGGSLDLGELVGVLQEQLSAKDNQIRELHVLLQQAQEQVNRMLPAPQTRRWWWPFS